MMKKVSIGKVENTALGTIWLAFTEDGLAAVGVRDSQASFSQQLARMRFDQIVVDQDRLAGSLEQMDEYLSGLRRSFDFPIDWSVLPPFQQSALRATWSIPYGQTRTYAQIAQQVGHPRAARAVGRAEATNPMPLVIPCHRVIGSDGKLHGYGAGDGLETKAWLLEMEGR
jgi:methylated-DNA-[protein]-cysteine S-methyltransferase